MTNLNSQGKRVQNSVAGSSDSPELDKDLQALTALRVKFHNRFDLLTKTDVRNATSGVFDLYDDVSNRFDQVENKLDAQDNLILTLREALRARQCKYPKPFHLVLYLNLVS